ncbi:HU family DNA-binding protein [Pseudonocardia hispaniensis]|uniref:HU family DNA-binding protein n=1 Tax=Pseudonocardia hispaniensis TaxID=904933 RepID=A0ABW1J741_9PSEU
MNKSQLVDALAARLGDRRTAASAVDGLLEIIVDTVGSGGSVSLTGFGVFEARARAPRVARNPRTGETVSVPATTVPAFRPGTSFKSLVSGNGAPSRPAPARRPRRTPAAAASPAVEAKTTPKAKPARSSGKAKASAPFSENRSAKVADTKATSKTATKASGKSTAKAAGKPTAEATAKPARKTAKAKK